MNDIDTLLNSYFEGSTTTEEERTLKRYFACDLIAPQHEIYRSLFDLFEKEKKAIVAPLYVIPTEEQKRKRLPSHKLWITSASVAAVILLGMIIFPLKRGSDTQPDYVVIVNGNRISNPQEAKEYAQIMFSQVSDIRREHNHSLQEAKEMQEKFNAATIIGEVKSRNNIKMTLNQ